MLNLKYFLIVLIIVLLGYLLYKNYYENKTLESFQTRNSLSSYFQSDDDTEQSIQKKYSRNEYGHSRNMLIYLPSNWNGSYKFEDAQGEHHYITFLQINKTVLFVIHKMSYIISGNDTDPYKLSNKNEPQCLPYMVIGKGELNLSETIFTLKHVYCSNDGNGNGEPYGPFSEPIDENTVNLLTAYIKDDDGSIILEQLLQNGVGKAGSATLKKEDSFKFGPSAEYLLRTSYNVPAPNVKNTIGVNPDVCHNTEFNNYRKTELEKCYITDYGMPTPGEKDKKYSDGANVYLYNEYGTGCVEKGKGIKTTVGGKQFNACPVSSNNQTCFIPIKNNTGTSQLSKVGEYPKCETSFTLGLKNQASLSYPFYKKETDTGNLLDICNHLEGFQSKKFNSAVLMYVDNLSVVHSLHFDFFGIQEGQNYLSTKLDIMFPFMNNTILKNYRENISDEKSLRLTNCLENNTSIKNYNDLLSNCKGKYENVSKIYNDMKSKIQESKKKDQFNNVKNMFNVMDTINTTINQKDSNKLLQPTVWQMEFLEEENNQKNISNYTNDCSFILSTSNKYNKEGRFVKYAEFDSFHNKTNMNLYKGGNRQKLVLENPFILDSLEERMGTDDYNKNGPNVDNFISNDYILLSGNLRTYHPKKYLLPGQGSDNNGDFGKQIYLSNELNPSGKWVILGFNLTKNLDVANSTLNYNSTLVKTLKKINDTMGEYSN